MKNEKLIVVPGLGDNRKANLCLTAHLGIESEIHLMPWQGIEQDFQPKLQKLLKRIDELTKQGINVSLLGTSAGGSAVLNAFYERQNDVLKVINVCGRLRRGSNIYPTLEEASKNSPSFFQSVLLCEERVQKLDVDIKNKILTIRPLYDEIVPITTVTIEGATNIQIVSVEHMLSIAAAMTIYSHHIRTFLSKNEVKR